MAASVASAGRIEATAGWPFSNARIACFTAPVPCPVTIRTEIVPRARSRARNVFVRRTASLTRSPCKSRTGSPGDGGSGGRRTPEVSQTRGGVRGYAHWSSARPFRRVAGRDRQRLGRIPGPRHGLRG